MRHSYLFGYINVMLVLQAHFLTPKLCNSLINDVNY